MAEKLVPLIEGQKFKLSATAELACIMRNGKASPTHVTCMLAGNVISTAQFYGPDGYLNEEGFKTLTEIFIHGLNANLQGAHQAGIIDSAKHLRHIISRLETLFVGVNEVIKIPINSVDIDD